MAGFIWESNRKTQEYDVALREILIEPDALGMTADPERARLANATC